MWNCLAKRIDLVNLTQLLFNARVIIWSIFSTPHKLRPKWLHLQPSARINLAKLSRVTISHFESVDQKVVFRNISPHFNPVTLLWSVSDLVTAAKFCLTSRWWVATFFGCKCSDLLQRSQRFGREITICSKRGRVKLKTDLSKQSVTLKWLEKWFGPIECLSVCLVCLSCLN